MIQTRERNHLRETAWRDPRANGTHRLEKAHHSHLHQAFWLADPGRGWLLQLLTMLLTKDFCTCWAETSWAAHTRRTKVTVAGRPAPPMGRTSKSLGQEAQAGQASSQQNNLLKLKQNKAILRNPAQLGKAIFTQLYPCLRKIAFCKPCFRASWSRNEGKHRQTPVTDTTSQRCLEDVAL